MAKEKILVVEDEEDILELVRYNLTKEGYRVSVTASGEEAMKKVPIEKPDLIVLDLMLPGVDGLEVCRRLKGDPQTQHIRIIMLTAKGEESDIIVGLEVGADDYITKPFSPRVLLARVRTVLRRPAASDLVQQKVIVRGEITIDAIRHVVTVKGKSVDLTATEFALLQFLAQKPGWVFTRQQIVDNVKGHDYAVTDRAVDVQIVGLRRKLGPYGKYIETVRGVGYRFKEM